MVSIPKKKRDKLSDRLCKPKVKICDFEKVSKIQGDFKNCVGLCDKEKRVIWIDSKAPREAKATRGVILQHEKCHLMLHDLGIKWNKRATERFCDYFALVTAPSKSLTAIELMQRASVLQGGLTGFWWGHLISLAHERLWDGKEYSDWEKQSDAIGKATGLGCRTSVLLSRP